MDFAIAHKAPETPAFVTDGYNEVMFKHVAEFVTLAAAINRVTGANTSAQIECTPLTTEEVAADVLITDVRAQLSLKHEQTELQIALRADSRPGSAYHVRLHAISEGACTKPFPGISHALNHTYGAHAADMILWAANDLSHDTDFQQQVRNIVQQAAMSKTPVKVTAAGYTETQNAQIFDR